MNEVAAASAIAQSGQDSRSPKAVFARISASSDNRTRSCEIAAAQEGGRMLSPVKYAPFRQARTVSADMRWFGRRLDMPLERDIAIRG